jgi:alkyl sulfatase BDS1-like metallo-beta-lactamase superfamily hydrolase
MGLGPFEEEGPLRVVAHEAVPARFARYAKTAGYNGCINGRQFGFPIEWPTEYRAPDVTYAHTMELDVGGVRFVLEHARGETDDHTFVWLPETRVLCTGDLFIWAAPNAGNPQKVQRYAEEWAAALRRMATLGAEVMCPGHGVPVVGKARIERALSETAELLESLAAQTLALMNEGATLDRVIHEVRAPAHLLERPYLRPIYDQPEFVVRNLWRLYGGWWDGDPSSLEPARASRVAAELASLAGGARALAERAKRLCAAGEVDVACHVVEQAWLADRADPVVRGARTQIYAERARLATSLMAKGIYTAASRESDE